MNCLLLVVQGYVGCQDMAEDLRAGMCSPVYENTQDYPLYYKRCALPHSGTVIACDADLQKATREVDSEP